MSGARGNDNNDDNDDDDDETTIPENLPPSSPESR